jgi:PAS domain S-box-containing protein
MIRDEMTSGRSVPSAPQDNPSAAHASRVIGAGDMADRIRAFDWSGTPLGPIEGWSIELLTIVNLTLSFSSPARIMWGPDLILIYNDAYRSIPGPRHPWALGKPAKEVYGESWPVVGPLLEAAYATGQTLFHEKLLVPLPTVNGMQDFYLNYSFNPIFENGKLAGLFGPLQDVTGEVLSVRQLRESEDRLARVLKSIGDAVIVTDAQTNITHMNSVAEHLTGWVAAEAEGQPLAEIFRIVNEVTRQTVESPADKVRKTGSIVGLANHTVLISKNGKDTAIDDSGAPIFDDRGELSGIVLVFRDISEKRATQREKDRLAERLAQFLGATSDAIVGVNRDWVMTYLNPKATQLYAADGPVLGRVLWEAFPGAVYEGSPYVENFTRAMNERVSCGFEAYYPEPLNLWLHIDVYPTSEGIVTFSRDITEEKRARQQLLEQTEKAERQRSEIEAVYRTAPIGLALFDIKDYRYLRLNDRQAEFFGLKPEQMVGRTLIEMAPIEGLKELFDQVLENKPVINFPLEGELATAPGEHRHWTVSYFPVLAGDGTVQAITAASLEVTAQKKAEQALIQSEKLAAVGRLAASIAHEINNPLEAVTNLLYLAESNDSLNETREYVQMAERELRRVSAIASQTLRFHKQSTSPQEVTGINLLDGVLSLLQSRIANFRIQVEMRDGATTPVRCFEGEIRQVLNNLIGNSIDAMQRHPGRLILRTRMGTHCPSQRQGLFITVADTGEGIRRSDLHRILEPFYTTKGMHGTGLGLWVSADIVRRHNGIMRFWSSQKEGRSGTVFTIFLPSDAATR